jgi:hypothetical protein
VSHMTFNDPPPNTGDFTTSGRATDSGLICVSGDVTQIPASFLWDTRAARNTALRISWWGEAVEQFPVGSSGVEQHPEPVVPEAAHPERHPLDPLHQIVDRLGRPVRHVGAVPCNDLVPPPLEGAAQPAHLEGHLMVGEVADGLIDPRFGELWVGVVIDLTDDLLSRNRPWVPVVAGVR